MFFPFGIKLALIVTFILLGSIWTITTLMAVMVSSEFARTAENSNFDINARAAAGIRDRCYLIRSEALLLLDMDMTFRSTTIQAQQIRTLFFERNPNIAAITVYGIQDILNPAFFSNNEISPDSLSAWISGETAAAEQAKKGVPVIKNVSPALGINLLALFYPWQGTGTQEAIIIFYSPENLSEISGTGSSTTFVINGDGDILVHPDFNKVLEGENIYGSPLAEALQKAPGESVRLEYSEGGNRFVGAGHRIPFADCAVFSSVGYNLITEQITGVTRRNIYLSVTVLFLAVLVTWFFSKTITNPLKKLNAAAIQVESGEFDLQLKAGSRDEFGALTLQFVKMGQGLAKWTDAKKLVGRYNDQEIFDRAMQGKIDLDGQYMKAVILSVEYITFGEIAETLPAPQSLLLLNEFIAKVTEQITKNHGLVDQIMGTRLIAVWNIISDAEAAVPLMDCLRTVISLRAGFWETNTDRESRGLPLFRMGSGIQAGEILAGRIGTAENYRYTAAGQIIDDAIVAGDACDSANLDIIVTGAVKDLAGPFIITEDPKLKSGRSRRKKYDQTKDFSELKLYGLVNLSPQGLEKPRWPFNLNDVRESLRKPKAVADEEENTKPAE